MKQDRTETTQDRTVCSQLSRLLAAATSDTCFFLSFRIARTSLSRYSFMYGVLEVFDITPP